MKRVLVAAVAGAALISPATAADLIIEPVDEVAMAHLHDWSGMYAGVHVGYLTGTTDANGGPIGGPLTGNDGPIDLTGWLAGAHAGVNFQDGSLVGGVEALVDYAPFTGDDGGLGGNINSLEGQFLGTLAGRVGFAADEFLFYLSGGGAVLTADATSNLPDETAGLTFLGWTVGAGAEFAVTEDVSLRADYRYYSFGQAVATFPITGYDMGFNPSFHTVSVGVSMAF